jgi:CDP-diacylglycerol--serine O-phosphatidyltransferase
MKKVKFSKSIHILPSLFTTGSLFLAFFSIVRSINGDHTTAAWSILFASLFDMVDGRLARMTQTQSEFGKEYDSLVDLSSFGMAPAILAYTWSLSQYRNFGWFLSFLFFACAALRLARFNVQPSHGTADKADKKRFQGFPTPGAACVMASFVLFYQEVIGIQSPARTWIVPVLVPLLAVLMVSNVRYRSFKEFNVQKTNYFYVLIGVAVFLGTIAINPNIVLFTGFFTYALSGPVWEIWLLRKQQKIIPKQKTRSKKFSVVSITRGEDNEKARNQNE